MERLTTRRDNQVLKFAQKSLKHPKHKHWFTVNQNNVNTRSQKNYFVEVKSNRQQLQNTPIAHMTKLLNRHQNQHNHNFNIIDTPY